MSFQAYLDNVSAQTGMSVTDFHEAAVERGLLEPGIKAGAVVAWLKVDYGLGHGHAMAIYKAISTAAAAPVDHFAGRRAGWRDAFETIRRAAFAFGDDVAIEPANSYLSLVRGGKKFAIVAVTATRMDVGLRLAVAPNHTRLEPAGSWNSMVTHRVRLHDPAQIDADLLEWLGAAYRAR